MPRLRPLLIDLTQLKPRSSASPRASPGSIPTPSPSPPEPPNPPPTDSLVPDLAPVPVPPIGRFPEAGERLHLAQTEPIDDPAGVALQLALITVTVGQLLDLEELLERRIRALEQPWRHRRD
jgi:hypothetical protein